MDLSQVAIEKTDNIIYLLNDKREITYCNPAWDRFALENAGESALGSAVCGVSIFSIIPEPLRPFYRDVYHFAVRDSRIITFNYHCSSMATFRLFQMQVVPRNLGGLIVVNSLMVEREHDVPGGMAMAEAYEDECGMISMCCHCRRTRRIGVENTWDWVPAYLSRPPLTISHGLCGICRAHYYKV